MMLNLYVILYYFDRRSIYSLICVFYYHIFYYYIYYYDLSMTLYYYIIRRIYCHIIVIYCHFIASGLIYQILCYMSQLVVSASNVICLVTLNIFPHSLQSHIYNFISIYQIYHMLFLIFYFLILFQITVYKKTLIEITVYKLEYKYL